MNAFPLKVGSLILTMLLSSMLSGCASHYSVNTNLNPDNVADYFKAGQVLLVQKNQDPPRPFNPLGLVDGESCQVYADNPPASLSDARTRLRLAAANKGGNAVILNNCVTYQDPEGGCLTRAVCIGQAIVMQAN